MEMDSLEIILFSDALVGCSVLSVLLARFPRSGNLWQSGVWALLRIWNFLQLRNPPRGFLVMGRDKSERQIFSVDEEMMLAGLHRVSPSLRCLLRFLFLRIVSARCRGCVAPLVGKEGKSPFEVIFFLNCAWISLFLFLL